MPRHLDMLKDVFDEDFSKSSHLETEIEQYLVMKDLIFIAHFPTIDELRACVQALSEKFRQMDQKDLYLKILLRYPDAALTRSSLEEVNLDDARKEQILLLQQTREREHHERLEWLKEKITNYHGDFIVLSGTAELSNNPP